MSARNVVILGAVVAIVGCLSPFIHLPIVGSLSYMMNGKGDGTFVIVVCVLAIVIASVRYASIGLVAGAVVAFFLFRVQGVMQTATAQMHASASNSSLFSGLANMMADAVYLEFGFYIVAAGATMMLIGGAVATGTRTRRTTAEAQPAEP